MTSGGSAKPVSRAIDSLSRVTDGFFRDPSTGKVVLVEKPNGKMKAIGSYWARLESSVLRT